MLRQYDSAPTPLQQVLLVLLRFTIGWHLFYQGWGKLRDVDWTSQGYLAYSTGPLSGLFQALAESPTLVWMADQGTQWGLIVFGLLLMFGLFSRLAAAGGAFLLLLFYLAAPPLADFTIAAPDGAERYVSKTLIEALALVFVMVFPTGRMAGLDILIRQWRNKRRDRYFGRR